VEICLEPTGVSIRAGIFNVPFGALETALRFGDSCNYQAEPMGTSILSARPLARRRDNDDICRWGPVRERAHMFTSIRKARNGCS
jgi:hypothetical protein